VVGVGPGLGDALVRRFARGGHPVALVARSREFIQSLAAEITAAGGRALAVSADVGDAEAVARAFDTVRAKLGPPEVLLYNAGSGKWGRITEITPAQFEESWRTNAYGAFLCAKQVVSEMIKNGRGVMLFTGATAGVKAGPLSAAFGPAKFAMRGLAQSLARDLGPLADAPGQERGPAEAGRDRRGLLAPCQPGRERLDAGTRRAPLQGEILGRRSVGSEQQP